MGLLNKWGIGPRCKLNLGNEETCLLLAGSGKVGSGSSAKRGGKNICRTKSRKLGRFVDTRSCCHSRATDKESEGRAHPSYSLAEICKEESPNRGLSWTKNSDHLARARVRAHTHS